MKKTVLLLADHFEEIEALTPVDYLRRAGINVTLASLGSTTVRSARGITVQADAELTTLTDTLFDAIIIPGGKGAWTIAESPQALDYIQMHYKHNKLIAGICAAPALVLGKALCLLSNKKYTCYPGLEKESPCGIYVDIPVIQDGIILTARGPGASGLFALAIIAALLNKDNAQEIAKTTLTLGDF